MGKNKKSKDFTKMLKENQKKITVMVKDERKTVQQLVNESVEGIVATSLGGIMPVSAAEAVESSLPDSKGLAISAHYSSAVYSMYQFILKNKDAKQTLIITLPSSVINEDDSISDMIKGEEGEFDGLSDRSDLDLVLDKIPEKQKKRLVKWAEEKGNTDIFVLKIPNLLLFHDVIKKKEPSKANLYDLVVQFVRTDKSLKKIKKKDNEQFREISKFICEKSVSVMKDFGVSCAHIYIDPRYFIDVHDYAHDWAEALSNGISEKNKILNRIIFCTPEPDTLVSFNQQLKDETAGLLKNFILF